ncbi:hypothetical protein SAMN05216327_12350 [Dyadobacter sp. SG02]|uniref:CcmD family protein n=1 Tax=Dyadobacter sp. SG02 TaxID=1855291 RepID=UPI0008AD1BBB|nr:hypothetical protein [Dyadobacter sp. SG02]SEJ84003.1 hypothetical protein SAMN05216327_12350 [Dyadobacter sp. SG02]
MKAFSKNISGLLLLVFTMLPMVGHAQGPVSELLRQDGKLWVVITVIAVVFAGLIYYTTRMNRRINRLKNRR